MVKKWLRKIRAPLSKGRGKGNVEGEEVSGHSRSGHSRQDQRGGIAGSSNAAVDDEGESDRGSTNHSRVSLNEGKSDETGKNEDKIRGAGAATPHAGKKKSGKKKKRSSWKGIVSSGKKDGDHDDDGKEANEIMSGALSKLEDPERILDVDLDNTSRVTNASKKKSKKKKTQKSSKETDRDDSGENSDEKYQNQGEGDTRVQETASSEKKKKKKKKEKKKRSSKKDRQIESLKQFLDKKDEIIESLNNSLLSMKEKVQELSKHSRDLSLEDSPDEVLSEEKGIDNDNLDGARVESDSTKLKAVESRDLKAEKAPLKSNESHSSEPSATSAVKSEDCVDGNITADSNDSVSIRDIEKSDDNSFSISNDEIESGNDGGIADGSDEKSLDPDDIISGNKSLSDVEKSGNASLDDVEVFDLNPPSPRPKKQFLEAALTARSLSDLNYVHASQDRRNMSMTDLKYVDDDGSLEDDEVFEVFPEIPRPKKQFLEAALTAKSLSDLNYVHAPQAPRRKSLTDLNYDDDDKSLGDDDVFDFDLSIPRPKKQFLDAALTAKSISDLKYVYSTQASEGSRKGDYNNSNDSLENVELFELEALVPRPKKQFLDAAMMAKSLSDLNYLHSDEEPKASRRKSFSDLKDDDDKSLGDDDVFDFDLEIPRPKKQFLDAALTAKSISDLNFVYSAQSPEGSLKEDNNDSKDSLGDFGLFDLDPIPRPKNQFLDAAMMAKSLSDLHYLHSDVEPRTRPRARRRKSLSDLKDDDDRSLGDDDLFDQDLSIPRPKKQFLEAALMAKSLSNLKFMYLTTVTYSSSIDTESRDDKSNVVPEHLLGLSQPNLFHSSDIHSIDNEDLFESLPGDPIDRPILKAALEAKAQQQEGIIIFSNRDAPNNSINDIQIAIVPEHLVIANQPATEHAHDNYSIEVEDIFEHPPVERNSRKPLLKAALEAHAQREEECEKSFSGLATENLVPEPLNIYEEFSKSVPDHLAIAHQPPTTELLPLDELSIDNDKLFDSPEPEGKNPLLKAALRAKEETQKMESPFNRSELEILKPVVRS
jgi:hypothetical protein